MPAENSAPAQKERERPTGTFDVLKHLASRLRSQPLVYALAALLVLTIIAGFSIEKLSMLIWPAIMLFIAGLLAWLAIEWRKLHSHDAARALDAEVDVNVRVRNVGVGGSVVGVEGLPTSRDPGK